jgi:hypothetical protein
MIGPSRRMIYTIRPKDKKFSLNCLAGGVKLGTTLTKKKKTMARRAWTLKMRKKSSLMTWRMKSMTTSSAMTRRREQALTNECLAQHRANAGASKTARPLHQESCGRGL